MSETIGDWCHGLFMQFADKVQKNPPAATAQERLFFVAYDCVSDLWNGGLDSLYGNSCGEYAGELPAALQALGMTQSAMVVKELNQLVFQGQVPANDLQREEVLAAFVEGCADEEVVRFRELERQLCELTQSSEHIYSALRAYGRAAGWD